MSTVEFICAVFTFWLVLLRWGVFLVNFCTMYDVFALLNEEQTLTVAINNQTMTRFKLFDFLCFFFSTYRLPMTNRCLSCIQSIILRTRNSISVTHSLWVMCAVCYVLYIIDCFLLFVDSWKICGLFPAHKNTTFMFALCVYTGIAIHF